MKEWQCVERKIAISYITRFEKLRMKEDVKIASYFLWVDEAFNGIRGLGEDIIDLLVVNKVLRTLAHQFDSKFSTIEEANDLIKLTIE